MGTIAIEGMRFFARHGWYREELETGHQFVVDVYLTADLSKGAATDDLSGTVDYEKVYEIIKKHMDRDAKLLEHVAQRILDGFKQANLGIQEARVRITKMNPPFSGEVEKVYIEMSSPL